MLKKQFYLRTNLKILEKIKNVKEIEKKLKIKKFKKSEIWFKKLKKLKNI